MDDITNIQTVDKATTLGYRTELFAPVMMEYDGKYIAVLSDDSIDRDDEKISKGCIERLGLDSGYIAGLVDHDNSVLKQVAEWTNRKVIEIDGHTALVAEPKFFKSNPNATIIRGMLDEGAKLGISIGAIVKNYDEIDGMRVFTELELLEASFVAIPSNRHGRAMAIAKSFNDRKTMEAKTMDKQFTQEDVDSALEKKTSEMKTDFEKQLADKDAKVTELEKSLLDSQKEVTEVKKSAEDAEEEKDDAEKKLKEAEESLEKTKKAALDKQKFANQGGDGDGEGGDGDDKDVAKAFDEGKLPIMRG